MKKLTTTQQVIIDDMIKRNLIIEYTFGIKRAVISIVTKDKKTIVRKLLPSVFEGLKAKNAIAMCETSHVGLTKHYYRVA